jgi:hypothetical protein
MSARVRRLARMGATEWSEERGVVQFNIKGSNPDIRPAKRNAPSFVKDYGGSLLTSLFRADEFFVILPWSS